MSNPSTTHVHHRFEDMLCEARALVTEAGWNVFRFHPSTIVLMRENTLLTITCSHRHRAERPARVLTPGMSSYGSS
jgi:very-short-patch-repair endonuclease